MDGQESTEPRAAQPVAPEPAGPPRRRLPAMVHRVTDRVPTSWFAGILTVVFLGATAAFGGLADVAAAPIPQIGAGDEHVSAQLSLTVDRAVLIDAFPEAGVEVEPGERVLALVVRVENRWTSPLLAGGPEGSVTQALRIPALGGAGPDAVARIDDATVSPWLQPGVPAEVVVTWAVDDELFAAGEDLAVDVRDSTLHTGQLITSGDDWFDPVTAAHLVLEVTDVGAGADAEPGSGTEPAA